MRVNNLNNNNLLTEQVQLYSLAPTKNQNGPFGNVRDQSRPLYWCPRTQQVYTWTNASRAQLESPTQNEIPVIYLSKFLKFNSA